MSTPVTTYDKRPVIVSPTAPTSLEQLRYLWLDISETTPVLRYYNSTGIWEAINGIDTSSFLTTNGVQTITGAKTFNPGTITVADITVDDVTIEGIDTVKLTDDDTHVPTSKLVEDTLVSAISGLETSIDGKLATKANSADVVLKTDISTSIPSAGAVDTKVASEKAVADSLAAKQNTLKYYSEGTDTVTIETAMDPSANVSIKAGETGLEMGHLSSTGVKLGVLSTGTLTQGLTIAGGKVDLVGSSFRINGSSPDVTTIVDSINLQEGGENALPTASAVRTAISQIKTDLGSALTYKGSVDTYEQLPEDAEVGDTWNVAQAYQTYPAGTNYAWTGTAWDALGGSVDLSGYQTKSDDTLATSAKTVVGAINEIENKVLDSHLSKLPYGTLYFNKGKLFGSNFAIPNFPFSICATVRVDSWEGSTDSMQTIFQFGDNGTGALWGSICFNNVINNPNIQLRISKNTDGTVSYSEVSYSFDKDTFLGKEHTIIGICRELESTPVNFDIYVDGAKVATTPYKGLTLDSLSGTVNYAVNTSNQNDSSQPASANPMMLRNLCIFNFDVSAEGSPYSIADYVAGRLIPPSLIGNQFTGMYGSGWSVSGDTATCSGTSTESYPRITGGEIPSGFNFTFTTDVEVSFSGTPKFEVYTNCQKAHAEIYDYSTQLTTQKNSAPGGGFYSNASLGITSSGHYKIKFDCESSLGGKGTIQMAFSALTSGTITLSDTYYSRCNLALENYTIARNATTKLVKDASGNSNDATVTGNVAGDNDQSIKVFVDEIKTQINQANG